MTMTGLTNHGFNVAATFMTVAAKTSQAAVNAMREQQRYAPPEEWGLETSGETVYIMDIMIEHLRDTTRGSAEIHNAWLHVAWANGVRFGPQYKPGSDHPKAVEWLALSTPAKIELNVIRGIVNSIVLSVVEPALIEQYLAALDNQTDAFMSRTVN